MIAASNNQTQVFWRQFDYSISEANSLCIWHLYSHCIQYGHLVFDGKKATELQLHLDITRKTRDFW